MHIESGYSPHDEERYFQEAIDQGVNFGIDEDQVSIMLRALGWGGDEDPMELIEGGNVVRARVWSESETKRLLERALCTTLSVVTGPMSRNLAERITNTYGIDPIFRYEVGFLGSDTTFVTKKIRTLEPPDPSQPREINPLLTTTFSRDIGAGVLNPLGALTIGLRVSSKDELPEVEQVARSEMELLGLRAWGKDRENGSDEVGGLAILFRNVANPQFQAILAPIRPYLEMYPGMVDDFQPRSAIMSPLSASLSKLTYFSTRLLGDLLYMTHADPTMWWYICKNSVWNKVIRRIGSK